MNPCSKDRKQIVWLIMDALSPPQAERLRSHLRVCDGCRAYHEVLSALKEKLREATVPSSISTSEFFHQRLLSRLQAEQPAPVSQPFTSYLCRLLLRPRVLVPVGCAAAMAITLFLVGPRHFNRTPGPENQQGAVTLQVQNLLQPTISTYQSAVDRSLDEFDELLTRQANRVLLTGSEHREPNLLAELEATSPGTAQ